MKQTLYFNNLFIRVLTKTTFYLSFYLYICETASIRILHLIFLHINAKLIRLDIFLVLKYLYIEFFMFKLVFTIYLRKLKRPLMF